MKKYHAAVSYQVTKYFEIEAENESQAEDIGYKMMDDYCPDFDHTCCEICDVYEINDEDDEYV